MTIDHEAYSALILDALGDVIREQRTERAWTQRELAEAAGVHVNVIGSIERGKSAMRLSTLVLIADALETTSALLMRETEARVKRAQAESSDQA